MKEFKINRDKDKLEPNEEQIKKYKDFATVSHGYQRLAKRPKKALYKDPKLFLVLLIIGLIFTLVFMESEKDPTKNASDKETIENNVVNQTDSLPPK